MPRVPRLQEALLPAGLAAAGILELILLRPVGWPVGMAGELIALGALLWRRVYPIVAPTVALAAVITMYAVGPAMDEPSVPIAILMLISFSYARYVDGLQGMVGLVLMGIGVAALYVTVDTREHDWSDVAFVTALIVPPYVLGRLTRRLWQQGEQLRAQQELIKDQAVRDERERIARELHDVIAHSISAMVLQASAAQTCCAKIPTARGGTGRVHRDRSHGTCRNQPAAQAHPRRRRRLDSRAEPGRSGRPHCRIRELRAKGAAGRGRRPCRPADCCSVVGLPNHPGIPDQRASACRG
jgi:hypothetical protein